MADAPTPAFPDPRRRVVITRPLEDAASLAQDLESAGFEPVIAPLMTINLTPGPAPDLDGAQAVAFTSANGVRAYGARRGRTDVPAFAVGPASATMCREIGFAQVHEAGGDVEKLADLILHHWDPDHGAVYHAAGATLAGDLVALLEQAGQPARRETLYEARAADRLPETLVEVLQTPADPPSVVTFLSPRTARLALHLMDEAGLIGTASGVVALCLSRAVGEAVEKARWRSVLVAPEPNTASILDCLESQTRIS